MFKKPLAIKYKMKKQFLLMLVFLLSMSMLSALDTLGTAKVDNDYQFCQVCSDATYITLSSVQTPTTNVNINSNMTSTGSGQFCYNYTPKEIGRYDFKGISDGCEKTFATYIEVSSTGNSDGATISLFLLLGASILMGIGMYFRNPYLGLFSGMLFIVAAIFMMVYGIGSVNDMYTRAIAYISLGIGLIVCFASVYEFFFLGENEIDIGADE